MVRSTKPLHPIVEASNQLSAITSSGLEEDNVVRLSVEQLRKLTDNFSQENLIGVTMCGKLYRGKISTNSKVVQHVTVKIWQPPPLIYMHPKHMYFKEYDNFPRLSKEVLLLRDPSFRNHPNFVKLFGYTPPPIHRAEQPIGVVYDINPIDTLHNLIPRDDFTWSQRIKVALVLSRLLEFLHSTDIPYVLRNLVPAHILIDQDFNPVLSDFALLVGGIVDPWPRVRKEHVYTGTDVFECCNASPHVSLDVYNFAAILLSLIGKRSVDVSARCFAIEVSVWARKSYKKSLLSCLLNKSLAHKSFKDDPNFRRKDAHKITELAMACMGLNQVTRLPGLKKVVELLQAIDV